MAFDPDAYLASKQAAPAAPAFDPDAYLRATGGGIPSGPRKTGTIVDQIPGYGRPVPAATAPIAPNAPVSLQERLLAPVETVVALGTGAITAPIVEGAKVLGALTSGKFGTQEGIRKGEETGRRVQQFFQPAISPTAQAQSEAISNALARTGLQGIPVNMLGDIATLARPAIQQVTPAIKAPIEARQARVQAQRVRESELAAPRIDAAKDALELGIALDPSISNPTRANILKSRLVGTTNLDAKLSQQNLPQYTLKAKEDLGLPATTKLDAKAFEQSRSRPELSQPYEEIRKLKNLTPDENVIAQLDALTATPLVGDTGQAAALNSLLNDVKTQISAGVDGSVLIDSIRQRRRDAQAIYNQQAKGVTPPSPEALAKADLSMGVANALENMIETNIGDPRLLGNFRKARAEMAKTYDYERATNFATGQIDPQVIAKMAEEGRPMTGILAKIGNVAANFPEVSKGEVPKRATWGEKLTRSSPAGTAGAIIGAPFGLMGSIVGGGIGAGVGNVLTALEARRMATRGYQAQRAIPQDYRPIPSGLTPAEINYGPNQLAPYDWRRAPNFVMVPEGEAPGAAPQFPQLPAPSFESTINALRAEDVRRAGVSRALGQQAEAQTAAAEAAARRPTAGEVILELDPVTGRLREASQGVRGATPETFSDFGASLTSAAEKATAGRAFDMTAAEKVAWNKTKVDLAEVAPGFKALNDKAIAAKMMDRAWVEQTAAKAREKAAAFEQLAARAADERARQTALANRERMMELAEQMEEGLRMARPDVSGKQQGPKTRAAQRNRLVSDQEVLNKLLEK